MSKSITRIEFISTVKNHVASINANAPNSEFELTWKIVNRTTLLVSAVVKGTENKLYNGSSFVSCEFTWDGKVVMKGHRKARISDVRLEQFKQLINHMVSNVLEYQERNGIENTVTPTYLNGSIDADELACFNEDGDEKLTRGGFCVADSLEAKQTAFDLINHIMGADDNALARLASFVLTDDAIAVGNSNVYKNGTVN